MSNAINWLSIMAALRTWIVAGSGLPDGSVIWKYGKVARPVAPFIELSIAELRQVSHDYNTTENNPLTFADTTVTVDVAGNRLVATAHPWVTGDGPINVTAGTTEPTPLAALTGYWLIVLDTGHVRLADSFVHAMQGTAITLTGAGVGTIKVVQTTDTVRAGQELVRTSHGIRECTLEMQCFAPEGSVFIAQATLTDVLSSLSLHADTLNNAGIGITDLGVAYSQGGVRLLEGKRGSILEPRALCEVTFYVTTSMSDFITFVETVQIAVRPNSDAGELPEIDLSL